ncbi:hypothetical protein FSARC_7396 [Fusarium sarcochroum]|uniref:Thiamine pyrophosphate enzyme TPP-binding domain-containing protein n=1 Tax=Fusarium sarcochroum TaxID=1208366 RepID=A0A8H4TVE5_9HYPO|nr:hypothetical protein FSARC_7396 [Fusarium sarcochroum]
MAMQEADLIMALGARFDDRVTLSIAKFAPDVKAAAAEGRGGIVHFEIMPKNINKELLPFVDSKSMDDRKEWFGKINEWKKNWPLSDYERDERQGKIKPHTLIEELSKLVEDRKDKTLVWVLWDGLLAAIGAKFDIGVKVIVLNNEEQGMVTQWQNIFYDDRCAHTHQSNPDFTKLAEAMRIQNGQVQPDDVVDSLKWLINTDGPALLEAITDKKVLVLPMVPAGSGLHEFLVFDRAKDKKRRGLMRERTGGLHVRRTPPEESKTFAQSVKCGGEAVQGVL